MLIKCIAIFSQGQGGALCERMDYVLESNGNAVLNKSFSKYLVYIYMYGCVEYLDQIQQGQ